MKISPKEYAELKTVVNSGKVAHFDGRTARTLKELDDIIRYSEATKWADEDGDKALAATLDNPLPGQPQISRKEVTLLEERIAGLERVVDALVTAGEQAKVAGNPGSTGAAVTK